MEVYRFGQRLGKRFSPISTFFSLVSSHAFRDAPHSCFRCGDPNQCLPNFLKMLLLALPQIYTHVFHLWKTIDLNTVWVGHSCLYQLSFLPQIYRRVFHLWKSVALDNAWVGDYCPFISFFHSRVFARLAKRHTRVFCVGILIYAYGALLKMLVLALPQIYTSVFYLWKSIDLDSACVRYSFPCQFSFLPRVLAR